VSGSPKEDGHLRQNEERPGADGGEFASPHGIGSEVPSSLHAAELRLIDGLLWSISDEAARDREGRIRRVMDAIDDRPDVSGRRARPRGWRSLVAVAACLTAACALFWIQFSQESRADDVLLEIGRVSSERIDRVYSFRRVLPTSGGADRHEGRLYLRGCDGFVITCGDVALGRNGDELWFVPRDGPVVVAEDFQWLVGESEHEQLEIELLNVLAIDSRILPLVQLSSAVELMRHDYDVALDADVLEGGRVDVLVGTLRDETKDLPDTIRLWSDRDSRIIRRAELQWRRPQEQSPANSVVLELTSAKGVGADWYNHEAHHLPGRQLHRISSGS